MGKFILLVFLLLGNGALEKTNRTKTDETEKIVAGISTYRTELLDKKNAVVKKIGALIMHVDAVEMKQEKKEKLQKYLVRSLNTKQCAAFFSQLAKKEIAKKRYKEIIQRFEELEIELVKINHAIVNLKFIGLLEMDYPYKIKKENGVVKEIEFYKINVGEKIADLKAEYGAMGILLTDLTQDKN